MSTGTKIDFKKPYGVVIGEHIAKYVQDGKQYGADGREIPEPKPEKK